MYLLHMKEWLGNARNPDIKPTVSDVCFAVGRNMTVEQALKRIYNYQRAFKAAYPNSGHPEFFLLGVSELELELSTECLSNAGVEIVEDLPQTPEEFKGYV